MVALYIQNTKKVVIIVFLLFCISKLPAQTKTTNYISLHLNIEQDSVFIGDSIRINLIFDNLSNKSIEFYPRSIFIVKRFIAFGIDNAMEITPLSNNADEFIVTIKPNKSHIISYIIAIDNKFFLKGNNTVWISYRFALLKQHTRTYEIKEKSIMESNEVELFVK